MSRLTDSDKSQIIELYRQPGETTLTLAERYGVSNTTISRILKSTLSSEEYEGLIQQKRFASRSGRSTVESPGQASLLEEATPAEPVEVPAAPVPEPVIAAEVEPMPDSEPQRRLRRRSSAPSVEEAAPIAELEPVKRDLEPITESTPAEELPEVAQVTTVEAIVGEDLTPNTGGMLEEDDDLDGDDLDDLDDLDDDGDDEPAILPSIQLSATDFIQVLPISEAAIPKTCYLVVDRAAELVARPLREFAELGQIPTAEIQEKTLPVFDNHRVAKRFSNIRTQRVIKVPDSRVLQKAAPYLQAKGITRLLIDGQVYAL